MADVIGKVSARAHRLANLGALAADLSGEHSWQCGGVPGLGTEFPALAIRMLQEKAKAEGTSIALIFVDARQAFYAVIRKLVLRVVELEHAIISLFEQLRIPPEAFEDLIGILANGPAMEESTLSSQLFQNVLLCDLLHGPGCAPHHRNQVQKPIHQKQPFRSISR